MAARNNCNEAADHSEDPHVPKEGKRNVGEADRARDDGNEILGQPKLGHGELLGIDCIVECRVVRGSDSGGALAGRLFCDCAVSEVCMKAISIK